jgi:protein TonB
MNTPIHRLWTSALLGGSAALLIGCAPPAAHAPAVPTASQPANPDSSNRGAPSVAPGPAQFPQAPRVSNAGTPREYRRDAASHLYAENAARIFRGPMPPHLYAIGVLEVDIDRQGRVGRLHWMRAPRHAPEVIREIERMVREAAPYPLPQRMGRVTYTDTWLWHKSGQFQLDTLTEGQL